MPKPMPMQNQTKLNQTTPHQHIEIAYWNWRENVDERKTEAKRWRIFFSPSYRVHTFNKSMKMVKCAAATPKKKIPPSHSFGIDSLFFLLHSHSLAHSFNSSDTQKTANDSNIQNQFQNETNEFLCDNFFFHPLLSRSFALARSLSLYYFPKRIFLHIVHVPCIPSEFTFLSDSTYIFHGKNLYANYHFVYIIFFLLPRAFFHSLFCVFFLCGY